MARLREIVFCPECGDLMIWKEELQAYICTDEECRLMLDKAGRPFGRQNVLKNEVERVR